MPANRPSNHPSVKFGKVGILLINLGTPDATSYWPMRRYLKEFLSDPRVVEANRALWWVILNAIILTRRPQKSGAAYDKIWNRERDESPMRTITRAQGDAVAACFKKQDNIVVDWAMRYGSPSIAERMQELRQQGCERILIFPLYPQYSAATTATALDKVFDALKAMRWQPAIRTVPPYFEQEAYIKALAKSIRAHEKNLGWKPDVIMASFHGLPVGFHEKGDPYYHQCAKTVELLRAELGLNDKQLIMTFQSRPGRREWLKPYTDETISALAKSGTKNLLVITPGFAADCLETLEEITIRAKQSFKENGGKNFSAQPCLNDSELSISMLNQLIEQQLSGWA